MNNMDEYKKTLNALLEMSVKDLKPDGVLLSGGIDSSVLAYLGKKANPDIYAVTVATRGKESPDVEYAKSVAKELSIHNHIVVEIVLEEMESIIKNVVIGLENFNIFWVSAAAVLYKGLQASAGLGLMNVLSGEGSDDLFGTFPVMQNWNYSPEELVDFISTRMTDIDCMTKRMGMLTGVHISLPFHNKTVVEFALGLPLDVRTKIQDDGSKVTKYLLRETFRDALPQRVIDRPQTMAFAGASTLDTFLDTYDNNDIAAFRKNYAMSFGSAFECHLFNIYQKAGLYHPVDTQPCCLYCKSALRAVDSVHCVSCGTLQYKGEILPF